MYSRNILFPLVMLSIFGVAVITGHITERPTAQPEDYVKELRGALNHHLGTTLPDTVYINQWASWCVACMKEKPTLNQIISDAKEKGNTHIAFISLTNQSEEEASKSAPDSELFQNIFNAEREVTNAIQAIMGFTNSIPINFLLVGDKVVYRAGFTDEEKQAELQSLIMVD